MIDNLVYATDTIRTSVNSLKKKLSNVKVTIEQFDAELDKIKGKFDKLEVQAEIYKAKLERESNREVRRLQAEISKLKSQLESRLTALPGEESDETEVSIASTIAIFECILRHMCEGAPDIQLMSYSFLFPSVFERVVAADDPAYFLEDLPASAQLVIQRGRKYVSYIRQECYTHVTDPEAWERFSSQVTDWWRNDALPLLYGSRDDQWDIDVPLTLAEMLMWRDEPSERPLHFSGVFDAYELYKKHKDEVYGSSGVRSFDMKMFTFKDFHSEQTEDC